MNIGSLIEMLKNNPEIANDIPGFLKTVNTRNIRQVEQIRTDVVERESLVSLAERNGGLATQEQVELALKEIGKEPLIEKARQTHEEIIAKIEAGEIKELEDVPDAAEAVADGN